MSKEKQYSNKLLDFIKGSSILIISNVCLKAINFFLLPLYTKNLSPTMLGVSDSITTLTGIVLPLLTMGLDSAYSAFYFDEEDKKRSLKVYTTITFVFIVLGLIPSIMILASTSISMLLFNTPDYRFIVMMALFSISLNLWFLPFSLELRLQNKMLLYGISGIVASLLMIVLNIVFVSMLKLRESALILSALIVHVEQLVFLSLAVRQKPQRKYFNGILLKQMLRFALPLVPATVMTWILSLSDRYVLLYYCGSESVGLYGISFRFMNLLNVVISAVSMAYTTFAFSTKEDASAKKQYYYVFNIESIILLFTSFSFAIFGKEVIMFMTDTSYATAYRSLRDLMFAQSIYAMSTIVGYGIFFEKKSVYSFYAGSVAAVVNLVLNFALIPQYGISAAASTTLIGYVINFIMVYYFSEKLYPCNYGIKRIGILTIGLYVVSLVSQEFGILIKIGLWIICVIISPLMFKDILKRILSFMNEFRYKNKKSKNKQRSK